MRVAASLILITLMAACARNAAPVEASAPVGDPAASLEEADGVDMVELPALQRDLVARSGSDSVYFSTDQDVLDEADRHTLSAHAQWLQANPNVRASIEGHADERGTREYNLALGERRAQAAMDYLIANGVPADRLLIVSWGKERPVDVGSYETAWAQNRRAVTVVVR